jgi:hypothetical protein
MRPPIPAYDRVLALSECSSQRHRYGAFSNGFFIDSATAGYCPPQGDDRCFLRLVPVFGQLSVLPLSPWGDTVYGNGMASLHVFCYSWYSYCIGGSGSAVGSHDAVSSLAGEISSSQGVGPVDLAPLAVCLRNGGDRVRDAVPPAMMGKRGLT